MELVPEREQSFANEEHCLLMFLAGGLNVLKATDARGGSLKVRLDGEAGFGDGREVFCECSLGVHFRKELCGVENVGFGDLLRRIAWNEFQQSKACGWIFCEWRWGFVGTDGLKEIEKGPFLAEAVTRVGFTAEIVFEKE